MRWKEQLAAGTLCLTLTLPLVLEPLHQDLSGIAHVAMSVGEEVHIHQSAPECVLVTEAVAGMIVVSVSSTAPRFTFVLQG
jgi:hypothetical protein